MSFGLTLSNANFFIPSVSLCSTPPLTIRGGERGHPSSFRKERTAAKAIRTAAKSKAPPKTLGGLRVELLAGLVRSRLVCDGIAIVRRRRDRVTSFRRSGQQPKAKPLGFFRGACDGATGRTCKEQTCLRRNSDRSPPARSRHVISAVRAAAESKAPRVFPRGLRWSYWPDLNRRPADYESAALPTEPQ